MPQLDFTYYNNGVFGFFFVFLVVYFIVLVYIVPRVYFSVSCRRLLLIHLQFLGRKFVNTLCLLTAWFFLGKKFLINDILVKLNVLKGCQNILKFSTQINYFFRFFNRKVYFKNFLSLDLYFKK